MKEYIRKSYRDDTKDIIKIRLHMWEVKVNYKKDDEDIKC